MRCGRIRGVSSPPPVLALLLGTALAACGDRPSLRLEPAEQYPTRVVRIEGLPSGAGPASVVVTAADGPADSAWSMRLRVEAPEAGTPRFRVPVHPDGVGVGGTLLVRVDGAEGPPLRLAVKPVPAAPGTTREVVRDAAEASRGLLRLWGVPASTAIRLVAEERSSLPPQVLFSGLALHLLDDPANPHSLLRALDGGAAAVPAELDAVDRLLAISGIPDAMHDVARTVGELAGGDADGRPPPARGTSALPAVFPSRWSLLAQLRLADAWARALLRRAAGGPRQEAINCDALPSMPKPDGRFWLEGNWVTGKVEIRTLAELGCYMRRRDAMEGALGGLQRNVRNDVVSLVGWVPSVYTAVLGVANTLLEWQVRSTLELLPSRLDPLSIRADPVEFLEDDERTGRWDATVDAHSGKLVVNVADLIDAIMLVWDVAGLRKAAGPKVLPREGRDEATERLLRNDFAERLAGMSDRELASLVDDMFAEIAVKEGLTRAQVEAIAYAVNRALEVAKRFLKGAELATWGPFDWKSIPVDDPLYAEASIRSRAEETPCARIVSPADRTYVAAAAGECLLLVQLQREAFGGVGTRGEQPIEVAAIRVTVGPDGREVDPGQEVEFVARVENAWVRSVDWSVSGGRSGRALPDGRYRWAAPPLAEGECRRGFTIKAESDTRRGPRHTGRPPRIGTSDITVRDPTGLRIVPDLVRLKPKGETEFAAKAGGAFTRGETTVVWDRDGGEIRPRGRGLKAAYTAPGEEGEYAVTAHPKGSSPSDCGDDATVIVRNSFCSWTLDVGGRSSAGRRGDIASFVALPGGGIGIGLGGAGGGVNLVVEGADRNATGPLAGGAQGHLEGSETQAYGSYGPPRLPLTVWIDENGPGWIVGRAEGKVRLFDLSRVPPVEKGPVGLRASFIVEDQEGPRNRTPQDIMSGDFGRLGENLRWLQALKGEAQAREAQEALRRLQERGGPALAGLGMDGFTCEIR